MRAVNLLPREANSKKFDFNSELAAAIAFTVLVAVAILGGFALERSHAGTERQRLAAVQAAYDRAVNQRPAAQAQLQVPAVLSQTQPWHLALDSALSTRVSWDILLAQLAYVVPGRILLTNVTFGSAADSSSSAGATSATLTLGGSAYNLHDIAVFLARLARVPKLSQVALVNSVANVETKIQTFQITAQVTLPVVPAAPAAPADAATTGGQT